MLRFYFATALIRLLLLFLVSPRRSQNVQSSGPHITAWRKRDLPTRKMTATTPEWVKHIIKCQITFIRFFFTSTFFSYTSSKKNTTSTLLHVLHISISLCVFRRIIICMVTKTTKHIQYEYTKCSAATDIYENCAILFCNLIMWSRSRSPNEWKRVNVFFSSLCRLSTVDTTRTNQILAKTFFFCFYLI